MSQLNDDYIKQHNLVTRYIRGQLTPEEATEFESYFIDKPELLEQIELETVLYEQIPKVEFQQQGESDSSANWLNIPMAWMGQSLANTLVAFASSCLLGIGLTLMLLQEEPGIQEAAGIGQVVYTDTYRSSQSDVRIQIDLQEEAHTLVLVSPVEVFNQDYQISLIREDSNTHVVSLQIRADANGELSVVIPVSLLHSGEYVLWVSAIVQQEQVEPKRVLLQIN